MHGEGGVPGQDWHFVHRQSEECGSLHGPPSVMHVVAVVCSVIG